MFIGDFEQTPNAHLTGQGCPFCANKYKDTSLFIEQANKIHNDKYGYLDTYTNSKTLFRMFCPTHGEFSQTPDNHLQGKGCIKCGYVNMVRHPNKKSWSYHSWEDQAKVSFNFDSYKVYIIRCFNDFENFIKIGKTFTTIDKRFNTNAMPYKYEVIKSIQFDDAKSCSDYEKQLHKKYKRSQYFPLISFHGDTECFEKEILNDT